MAPDHQWDTTTVDNPKVGPQTLSQFNKFFSYQHLKNVALLISCKYVGSTSTVDNVATESMDLPLLFSWFTGPTERKGAAAAVDLEGSLASSIHEGKWYNALGTAP